MLQVGEDGSMEIPSELREKLGIEAGTKLVARVEGDRLVLTNPKAILEKLKDLFAHIPPHISLADELIAERHAEAERELYS